MERPGSTLEGDGDSGEDGQRPGGDGDGQPARAGEGLLVGEGRLLWSGWIEPERPHRSNKPTQRQSAQQTAEVRPVVNSALQADSEVENGDDDDVLQAAPPALAEQPAVAIEEDAFRADQAEDRAGRADGVIRVEQQAHDRTRQPGDQKYKAKTQRAAEGFDLSPEVIERVSVEEDVQDVAVKENGGEQPPDFAMGNQQVVFGPVVCKVNVKKCGKGELRGERQADQDEHYVRDPYPLERQAHADLR